MPNEYVLSLAGKHREFLPAVSIHPARRDALEELERCLGRWRGDDEDSPRTARILTATPGVITRFWERMAEAKLPLLAHTGGEHTLPVVRPDLASPRTLQLPLECGVTVVAAHCGTRSGIVDPDYWPAFVDMARRYPKLYGDNSAFNVPIRGRRIAECLRGWLADRILHGSDLPVPVHGHFACLNGHVDWATFWKWERDPNVLERDYQLKKASGFSAGVFSRWKQVLRSGPQTPPKAAS